MAATAKWTFQMLENESLWETAVRVHAMLKRRGIDHAIVGGVAVCLHGYRRNTVDLDVLVDPKDAAKLRGFMEAAGFEWSAAQKEFRSSSDIAVHFVMAGDSQGPGQEARFPIPRGSKYVTTIEGLAVLTLAQIIQSKIACALGDMRRTHKDFADVVELIAIHKLNNSFARHLHKSLRKEFRILVERAGGRG
jgi:hypothetical protein